MMPSSKNLLPDLAAPLTVRNQLKVIMRKLELKNRVQVAYLFGQQANIDEIAV